MLSGVKFISRDKLDSGEDNEGGDSMTKRKKSRGKRDKHRTSKRSSHQSASSSDDHQRIEKRHRKGKKWYSSDEYSSSEEGSSDRQSGRKNQKRRKSKNNMDAIGHNSKHNSKERGNRHHSKQEYSSPSPSTSEDSDVAAEGETTLLKGTAVNINIARKEMGLDWMLGPAETTDKKPALVPVLPEEPPADEQMLKLNPRELNPYLKNNGTGYPVEEKTADRDRLPSSSVVGDGGASWRLKALKRAKEQAAREGRKLDEVVGERWDSVGQLAVSAAYSAAPARAHLHEIKNRKRAITQENETSLDGENEKNLQQNVSRSYSKSVSVPRPEMRAPKVHDTLSWGRKGKSLSASDDSIIAAAASSLNKFSDDGSFMSGFLNQKTVSPGEDADSSGDHGSVSDSKAIPCTKNVISEASTNVKQQMSTNVEQQMSANQLAAKALQLRLKGKHEEAEKLMQEAAIAKANQSAGKTSSRELMIGSRRQVIQNTSTRKMDDDADRNLAQTIIQNRKYSSANPADDEYDYELAPSKKSLKKSAANGHKTSDRSSHPQRFLTQPERCIFCFENPNRPKHLVVSIANFTYLMLPQRQSVVPGHCCILPLQHESATRSVDNNVWQEIRNFKKCLIKMFAQQEKEVVYLETVVELSKQRRHCLVECIPLPREIAKEAPLYFKKAIDEAEDEWSQHNAKKLIDTSEKGLRGSIPKDFPYFHVEFGLDKGFVHVIDDETQFNTSMGLNVIRGMLRLPEEDMYRSRRRESVETQKQAVTNFLRDWEPFDWTKQLD